MIPTGCHSQLGGSHADPTTRRQHNRRRLRYGSDLTDAEWEIIAPLLPPPNGAKFAVDAAGRHDHDDLSGGIDNRRGDVAGGKPVGPWLIWSFIEDRRIQAVIGLFIATILYTLLVLRTVEDQLGPEAVPHVAITVASVLTVACLFALLFHVNLVARSIVSDTIVGQVAGALDTSVRKLPQAEAQGEVFEVGCRIIVFVPFSGLRQSHLVSPEKKSPVICSAVGSCTD